MARSTTPPRIDLHAFALGEATGLSGPCLAVAYSGGRDSTALLHAAACMAREQSGMQVLALHVHHGLSLHADDWLAHAQAQCQKWASEGLPVVLHWQHLHLMPESGDSIEALAREGRYRALSDMATTLGCNMVLLAHHQQDQAETFLLQAMRGAGVAGLSSMPRQALRDGIHWVRPWLHLTSEAIDHYIEHHGLSHIEDDSNADVRLARNRLRLDVWPRMVNAFAQAEKGLAQSAVHQADVKACLDDWLALKLPSITQTVAYEHGLGLLVSAWRTFGDGPQRELLRAWFHRVTGHVLPASWVNRLHREVKGAVAHWPMSWHHGTKESLHGQLVLYRGVLSWRPMALDADFAVDDDEPFNAPIALSFQQVGCYPVPQAGGTMQLLDATNKGVALHRLHACELRWRQGGEQFQMAPDRPVRCLKKQFQTMGVPSYARNQPLLWSGNQLIFVPGLGIDARAWGQTSEARVSLAWLPDADRLK